MQVHAVYFARECQPGEHWNERATADDPDRTQHWKTGDLYSESSTPPVGLPSQFASVLVDKMPGGVWNIETLRYDAPAPVALGDPDAQALHDAGFPEAARVLLTRKQGSHAP